VRLSLSLISLRSFRPKSDTVKGGQAPSYFKQTAPEAIPF
jgi:hypothetical protein